jgi:hypothetical protein
LPDDITNWNANGAGSSFNGLGPYLLETPSGFAGNYSDVIIPAPEAEVAFWGNEGPAGTSYRTDTFESVYLGFPFEMIPGTTNRTNILRRFLNWCRFYDSFLPMINR